MKLSFHGAKYEFHPTDVKATEGEVGGTYRGRPWRVHRVQEQRRSQHHVDLTYRGVHYTR